MKMNSDKSAVEVVVHLSIVLILLTALSILEGQSAQDKSKKTGSRTQSGVFSDDIEDDGVLIDFRSELAFDTQRLAPARKRAILKAVYGTDDGANDIEINSIANGSFTQSSAKETAYLLQIGGARAAEPSSLEKTKLAIFHGTDLVSKFDVKDYNFILRTSDLDRDGLDELLRSGSNYQMGESTRWAKLVEIEAKQLREIKDFSTVLKDSCDNPTAQNRDIKAALIKYDPQNTSQIAISYYRAACSAKKNDKLYPDIFKLTSDASIAKSKS